MTIIYLILAQRSPNLLLNLVSALKDDDSHFVIHVNKTIPLVNFTTQFDVASIKIHFLKKRHSTERGSFETVKAILGGLRYINNNYKKSDRIILLTDQDFPIKSNEYIRAYFSKYPKTIFIDSFKIPSNRWYEDGVTRFPTFQTINDIMPIYGGLMWFSMPIETVKIIFTFLKVNPDYLTYFKLVKVPEESFFQTLLMNTEIDSLISNIVNGNKIHFVKLGKYDFNQKILTIEDFHTLANSEYLFARKFHPVISKDLLIKIDAQILGSKLTMGTLSKQNVSKSYKNALLLLTNEANDSIFRLFANLKSCISKKDKAIILYHAQDREILPTCFGQLDPSSIFSFDNSILSTSGYRPISTTLIPGSNHFPLLQFYLKNPNYDFYWQIENDVYYAGDWKNFFDYFVNEEITSDFLTTHIRSFNDEPLWHWWDTFHHPHSFIPNESKLRSFNPIFRISNEALKLIHDKLLNGWFGHHEVLIPTLLNNEGFSINDFGGLGEYVLPKCESRFYVPSLPTHNGSLNTGSVRYRPEIAKAEVKPDLLYHPIKFDQEFQQVNDSKSKNDLKTTFIVIVTYNGIEFISKCIESIINTISENQIIVVDNHSTDGCDSFIERHFPSVTLIKNKENLGFGRANNIGIQKALTSGAEYILLLNQDAYLTHKCLETLHVTAIKFPSYGIISPIHLRGDGLSLDLHFHNFISHLRDFWSAIYLNQTVADIYQVGFVNAACWHLSRACIEKVGGFDPDFFLYGEDDNYINRAHYHGFKVGVVPSAQVVHDREELNNFSKWNEADQLYNRLLIELKDITKPLNVTLRQIIVNILLLNSLGSIIKFRFKRFKMYTYVLIKISRVLKLIKNKREITSKTGAFLKFTL